MFTLEEKLAAVKLVRGGMSYRQASRVCGASYHSVWKWHRALDGGAHGLYALVDHRRRPKEMDPMDLDDLPDDPEELKRIIRDQQFEIDITKAVMEIVKKAPASTRGRCPTRTRRPWSTPWRGCTHGIRSAFWLHRFISHQRLSTITGRGSARIGKRG